MKVYVVISSYQHGLGEAVEVDAEVFSTIDKARKAIGHKGMNTLENYKRVLNCDDYLYNISDSFFHISDSEGETWDNFDIVEQELK
ncbi:MAG: hypothetical protein ACLT4A_11500 [Anaerobutyricum soehngenii]|jgi:hypothetical protein|uniref:hypothetical protein n=1 Tax=Prevotellaceae TaxID=171552 RepID=UPI00220A6686|nr:MAG: hypothetical protein [Bacteriophage sp.]